MSRIGKRELVIPEGVTIEVENNNAIVKSNKGSLSLEIPKCLSVEVKENKALVKMNEETKDANMLQGTINSLLNNMLKGVSEGYKVELEAVGVGYRFGLKGNTIVINAGYSHPVEIELPEGIKAESNSNTELTLSGIDKQKITEFAANVRKVREPEPYKGKGIRYKGEHIRRKEGKKAA